MGGDAVEAAAAGSGAAAAAAAFPPSGTKDASSSSSSLSGALAVLGMFGLPVIGMLSPWAAVVASLLLGFAAWWLASSGSNEGAEPLAMKELPGAAAGATTAAQDEDLGLEPPNYAAGGRSMTSRAKSTVRKQSAVAATEGTAAAAPQQSSSAAVPAVAGGTAVAASAAAVAAAGIAAGAAVAGVAAAAGEDGSSRAQATPALANGLPPRQPQQQQAQQPAPALEPPAAAGDAPVALTGSAAILAKLRQQRQTSSSGSAPANSSQRQQGAAAGPKVTVLYASQTGTGQEIARSIHAQCAADGLPADVMSLNELGFDNLTPANTPLVVVVASSTGDGDPPDNSAAAYVALKKPWPADRMAGVRFTVLGLGDSNYTRFMHVPRTIKNRLQELGAEAFYPCVEADEVDGLEDTVDPWVEGIVAPLQQALQDIKARGPGGAAADPAAATAAGAAATAGSRPPSVSSSSKATDPLAPEQSSSLVAAGAGAAAGAAAAAAACAGRVTAELSSGGSGAAPLSAQDSVTSAAGDGAAAAPEAAAAAVAAAAAAGTPPATPPVKLVNGLAPQGVDLKGVPPLAPCRISLRQDLPHAAAQAVRDREAALPGVEQKAHRDATGAYSATAPFWATVTDAKLLTAEWSDRTVVNIELDLADSGMRFSAGDAVGVLPANDPALVAALLARLGVDGEQVFEVEPAEAGGATPGGGLLQHIPAPCTFRHAFAVGTDLTSVPRKSLLRLLAEHCGDADEARTLLFLTSRAGREAYAEEVAAGQPSLLDLLRLFPSCSPPVDALLDALPPLAPRMYSLTNAPVQGGDGGVPGAVGARRAQFALSVVEFATQYGTRRGVATSWLAKLCRPWLSGQVAPGTPPSAMPEAWVPLFLRRAVGFRPPASLDTPLIMVGPGTGVAPFRGFVQQRLADMQAAGNSAPAPALLYYGCRKPEEDYLYEEDWRQLQEAGALTKLRVAFSRAQAAKVYVQHLLKEDAKEVAKLVASGAHVYVCGDGAAMAKDVHAALAAILRDQLGVSEAQASQELAAMAKEGRYVRDIWS